MLYFTYIYLVKPLAKGLGKNPTAIYTRIYSWTMEHGDISQSVGKLQVQFMTV